MPVSVRSLSLACAIACLGAVAPDTAHSQEVQIYHGPGGYFSLTKLILIIVVFLIWVRLADWINRDSLKIGSRTKLEPVAWNPLNVGVFFLGFLTTISLPIFLAGYSIYVICAFTPFLVYIFMRSSKLKHDPNIAKQLLGKPGDVPEAPPLPQDEGIHIEFSPAGEDKKAKQVNLIRARQSPGFVTFKDLLADALSKRADVVLLDYTRQQVNGRLQVDGVWHPLPALDRPTGDAVLFSMKHLAGLNADERKKQQTGSFGLKTDTEKANIELLTQGVQTGERVQLKFRRPVKTDLTLGQLGMFPDMLEHLKATMNQPRLTVISAPPGEGLTSTWKGALTAADRLTRDCVAIVAADENETTVENIALQHYGTSPEQTQAEVLRSSLLTQPDLVVCSTVEDKSVMDLLTQQVLTQDRTVILRAPARSAAEGLLRMYAAAGDRDQFANAVKVAMGQRLIRRLCDTCKQEVRVPPKTIQQLGGDPRQQQTVFNQYKLPPPDQRVDEKGKPIEFPPCETCGGIGYLGRIAVFEMLEVNESVKAALKQTPKPEAIEKAAVQAGKKTIAQQAYRLVLLGVTSLAEVQRVLK